MTNSYFLESFQTLSLIMTSSSKDILRLNGQIHKLSCINIHRHKVKLTHAFINTIDLLLPVAVHKVAIYITHSPPNFELNITYKKVFRLEFYT